MGLEDKVSILFVYSNATSEVVEKVTGGTLQQRLDYVELNYDLDEYGATSSPAFGMADGLIDTGDAKRTELTE